VYLKLKRHSKVEEDCGMVLLLLQQRDSGALPSWECPSLAELDGADVKKLRAKVLYRRALARKELGNVREALTVSGYITEGRGERGGKRRGEEV
jgi:hypothetical protein